MPSENKYEIRSQDVQEVLSTPPRFLTIWGTALIVVVLTLGVVFLSGYKISQTMLVPVQVIETDGRVGLMIESALAVQIKTNQQLKLQLKNDNISIEGNIVGIIDTAVNISHMKILFLSEYSSRKLHEKLALNGVINGEAEIHIGKKSLWNLLPRNKIKSL